MTREEFAAWARHTDRSRRGWQRDEVQLRNRGVLLMYHGGANGTYVMVDGCKVTVGTYEGACPHIGEALFRVTGHKVYATEAAAFEAVVSATGVRGLLAAMGVVP